MVTSHVVFSVLMANHNRSEFISESIESVLNQSFIDFELLICDDNSTDESISIIQKYQNQDSRIQLFTNETNKGAGFTKAFLAKQAKGEVSGFFDSDDFLDQTALEKMVFLHRNFPEKAIIYSNHFVCDSQLNVIKKGSSRYIPKTENHLTYFGISHFATYKTACYKQTIGINETLSKAVDQDLYYKLEEQGERYFLDECLYHYRHNNASISLNKEQSKANDAKFEVMQDAIERRKNTNIKFPSESYFRFMKYKSSTGKGIVSYFLQNPFSHFRVLLYYCFTNIKNRFIS